MYYFTSDTHFGHGNIIKYTNRPFKNTKEMDEAIIKNWNDKVKPEDLVFFLGDFNLVKSKEAPDGKSFEYYRNQLNGQIVFIKGNHDRGQQCRTIITNVVIEHGGYRILLTHNPKHASKDYKINLCGHVHDKWKIEKLDKNSFIVNVSLENWGYTPVDINEILKELSKWKKEHEKK
jgi:calcineurin-like phosphoesterase family protein